MQHRENREWLGAVSGQQMGVVLCCVGFDLLQRACSFCLPVQVSGTPLLPADRREAAGLHGAENGGAPGELGG